LVRAGFLVWTGFGHYIARIPNLFRYVGIRHEGSDALASTPFFGTLVQPLQFTRSLLGADIIGNFSTGTGELQLSNTDGGYDFLIQDFSD
jgi:hypothetical protein